MDVQETAERRLRGRISGHPSGLDSWERRRSLVLLPARFKPLHLNLDPKALKGGNDQRPIRDKIVREIAFSDGGVYDNLGLEPIWKDHEVVLASDGGALFRIGGTTGFAWEIGRYIEIPENQALAVRKRWLISNFVSGQMKGTYWGIGGTVAEYDLEGGYSEDVVRNFIAAIRTDLDSFSDAEACVLENHGYALADAAIQNASGAAAPTGA